MALATTRAVVRKMTKHLRPWEVLLGASPSVYAGLWHQACLYGSPAVRSFFLGVEPVGGPGVRKEEATCCAGRLT